METEVGRVTNTQAVEQQKRFQETLTGLREDGGNREQSVALDKEIYDNWKHIIPGNNFGEVSLTKALAGIETGFAVALKEGRGDDYLKKLVSEDSDYSQIYLNRTDRELSGNSAVCRQNHQPSFLQETTQKLLAFLQSEELAKLPPVYRSAYQDSAQQWLRFCETAQQLGKPELTTSYYSIEQWQDIIDLDKSRLQGSLILKYEQEARALLEEEPRESSFRTVGEALARWNLNSEERAQISASDEDGVLPTPDVLVLGNIAFKRAFGPETKWHSEIVENQPAMDTDAKSQVVKVPPTRIFTPDEIVYIYPHEFVHALSGENGKQQPCQLMQEGMEGYLETQEGIAVLAELIMGEPYGHERQRVFAARYLAVAMALKAEEVDGQVQPKYSIQDIYNELRNYGISEKQAASTVWRVIRGTSLLHQGTKLTLNDQSGEMNVPVAETFPKDHVYFVGMMKVLDWFRDTIPVEEGVPTSRTVSTKDFSDPKTLIWIGYMRYKQEQELQGKDLKSIFSWVADNYNRLAGMGKDTLLELLNYLLAGKLKFDDFETWKDVLVRDGLVDYRSFFVPRTDMQTK